jgi:mannose-6-phosphate isomerase
MSEIGERSWGKYFVLADEPNYKLKRIEVNPGQKQSYQYYYKRQEQWKVIDGDATIVLENKEIKLANGEDVFIEVQIGIYFGEDDIVRLDDKYERTV